MLRQRMGATLTRESDLPVEKSAQDGSARNCYKRVVSVAMLDKLVSQVSNILSYTTARS